MRSLFACLLLLSVPALRASAEDAAPISLHSSKAKVTGTMLRYEPEPHKNTLGYWTKVEDTALPGAQDVRVGVDRGKVLVDRDLAEPDDPDAQRRAHRPSAAR